jgi:nicotinamide-nucleotide amidase
MRGNQEAPGMATVPLEEKVGQLLTDRGLTIATAESCTGGLLGHYLTNVSGSSLYVLGGIIAYSNGAKMGLLGVNGSTLEAHGAVSEPAALEMARGARARLGADLALSTTGIAGPTGGTPDKPVGLAYIGFSAANGERCERHVWGGDRLENKRLTVEAALEMLLNYLEGNAALLGAESDTVRNLISVDATLGVGGALKVISFAWRDRIVWVTDTGRQWEEPSPYGLKRCVLVMSSDHSTFELCLDGADGLWHLRQLWSAPAPV